MIDEETLAQINGKYVMPPDAGPAWREAAEAGIDMSLIEQNLEMSPWERLLRNDRALALARMMETSRATADGGTY